MTTEQNTTQPNEDLTRLYHAVRALAKTVNQALLTGTYDGTGDLVVKNYQRLHAKAVEILPDDYFIETFSLEADPALEDKQKLAQVQTMVMQLSTYLHSLIKDKRPQSPEIEDLKNLGAELRDQILHMTKTTIKQALSNIEYNIDEEFFGEDSDYKAYDEKRKREVKVKVELEKDDKADDEKDEHGQDASKSNRDSSNFV